MGLDRREGLIQREDPPLSVSSSVSHALGGNPPDGGFIRYSNRTEMGGVTLGCGVGVFHLQGTVEEDAFFHGQHRRGDSTVDDRRCSQLHFISGVNIPCNFSLTDDRAGRHFRCDDGFFADQQDAIGMDFSVKSPINPYGSVIGDCALEHDALADERADILAGFVPHRFKARSIAFNVNLVGTPAVLFVLPHMLASSHDLG
ncbi:hypothetical protein COMA2_170085 [Candidatus Nitrospira nitrificans]|uniref:Uncharacterized protein n=1 Tax=Candidatus Nitrospira nitrificans TaxID=1742973 RepID=A0A0S4LF89_9BACT|nr:hypothetical protein COMA2_170085 [Candidatus Nitrospira nitrificans]